MFTKWPGFRRGFWTVISLSWCVSACGSALPEEEAAWRDARLDELLAPTGWVNLIGLHWLDTGVVIAGPQPGTEIRLRAGTPNLKFRADAGLALVEGETVNEALDPQVASEVLAVGDYLFKAIERDGRIAIRTWDTTRAEREDFRGVDYFPYSPDWQVAATFVPIARPVQAEVETVVEGLWYRPAVAGHLHFDLAGETQVLKAYENGDLLFVIFADLTGQANETYPGGRYLYVPFPGDDGHLQINFNRAENPPCVYTDYATCPLAELENRLSVAVRAGERYPESP